MEELGYFDIMHLRLIGIFEAYLPGPTGIKFVSALRTDATLEQIQQVNRMALRIYNHHLGKGISESDAKEDLKKRRLPQDAWEHPAILGFPRNKVALEYILNAMPQSFSGIGAGALATYITALGLRKEADLDVW